MGSTPGGQYYLRRGLPTSPASLPSRLAKEKNTPIPIDSCRIPGFPYFTEADKAAYLHWKSSGDVNYRPSPSLVLDKYPIKTREIKGSEMPSDVVGIYDAQNQLWEIDREESRVQEGRVFLTTSGEHYFVSDDRDYQVVEVDQTYF